MENLSHYAKRLACKEISSVELTKTCLEKALGNQDKTHAYISLTPELALLQAAESDKRRSQGECRGPLDGIPYSLKDLFITKGIRTTAASRILFNYIPPYQGHTALKLQEAGGVLIGKANCDEFGMGSTNENSAFSPSKNPINQDLVPGGSSGGSAVCVAEGSSLYSIGTDTGGSSRLPAAFCGVVGMKPSYGRVSRQGQIAYGSGLDQAAPLALSSIDMSYILSPLTQKDPGDTTQSTESFLDATKSLEDLPENYLKGKRLGYIPSLIDGADEDVRKAMEKSLKFLKNAGVELIEIDLPHMQYSTAVYYIIAMSEASSNLARFDGIRFGRQAQGASGVQELYRKSRAEGLGHEVKKRIMLGTFALSAGHYDAYFYKAAQIRRLIAEDYAKAFEKCDMIFSPVSASTAYKAGSFNDDPLKMYLNDMYTIPVNLAGLPALAMPVQTKKMPTAFQFIAPYWHDQKVLEWGHAFEKIENNKYEVKL